MCISWCLFPKPSEKNMLSQNGNSSPSFRDDLKQKTTPPSNEVTHHQIIIKLWWTPSSPPQKKTPTHPPHTSSTASHQPSRHIFLVHFIGRKVWTLEDREVSYNNPESWRSRNEYTVKARWSRVTYRFKTPWVYGKHLRFCCKDETSKYAKLVEFFFV